MWFGANILIPDNMLPLQLGISSHNGGFLHKVGMTKGGRPFDYAQRDEWAYLSTCLATIGCMVCEIVIINQNKELLSKALLASVNFVVATIRNAFINKPRR